MAAGIPPQKHAGVTVGAIADEEGASIWWFCDDFEGCRFGSQLDPATLIENRGARAWSTISSMHPARVAESPDIFRSRGSAIPRKSAGREH